MEIVENGLAHCHRSCGLAPPPPQSPTARAVLDRPSFLGRPNRSGGSGEEWMVGFGDGSVQNVEDVCMLRELPWSTHERTQFIFDHVLNRDVLLDPVY